MASIDNKENFAPLTSSDPLSAKNAGTPSPKRAARRGRSKSIGPGGLEEEPEKLKQEAKNRRKSTYVPATKSIISTDVEKAERQAARRKTLANRRVSFAPEATLHTWDVVEFMRDPTTSTESSDNTRRTSRGTPYKKAPARNSDDFSSPAEASTGALSSPAPSSKRRRNSGFPLQSLDDSNIDSSDGEGGSEESESGQEDADGTDDDTGTAMSLDVDNSTIQSLVGSEGGSTDSSARLEAALRQAASTAGTRGIEYDEYGDQSMELAGEEVTNAFQPWMQQRAAALPVGSAETDQENINPFSPAFKAQLISGRVNRPSTVREEDTGDLSMDITRAAGGVLHQSEHRVESSPLGEAAMDLTKAVGSIQPSAQDYSSPQTRSGLKRRRSTTDTGSPAVTVDVGPSKRRRSSVARSSMGDDTMDLTVAVGGIQSTGSPKRHDRRKSIAKRRSSGVVSEQDDATMEFTQAVGRIKAGNRADNTGSSFDENEELTMELTTVLGGIKATERALTQSQPSTPQNQSAPKEAVNTTPKDQERFKDAPDSGPKKLLTPIFQKQVHLSPDKAGSVRASPNTSATSARSIRMRSVAAFQQPESAKISNTPEASLSNVQVNALQIPSIGKPKSPLRPTPTSSPAGKQKSVTPDSVSRSQLDAQLQTPEPSPSLEMQQRSSPMKVPSTPQQPEETTVDARRLAESIKLMSTPRKETLKNVTPKKPVQQSPQAAPTSRPRSTTNVQLDAKTSLARQLSEDLNRIQDGGHSTEKIQLQQFLDTAGIRFMDLTTTKRRMTTAPTPSKARKAGQLDDADDGAEINLASAIVASGCTLPELEMYEHACHELKRYISDGKRVIKELEVQTAKETPPLIQAYMSAGAKRKAVIDAQMRDIKTNARYRSKEMWYSWRTMLLEDLMKALQGIGEGLIRDNEALQHAERTMQNVLPELVRQHESLQVEADRLHEQSAADSEEDKEELEIARQQLVDVDAEIRVRQKTLGSLQAEIDEQQARVNDLEESKEEFVAAIQEADLVKEACRGVSINEIAGLKESIHDLEESHGWSITSSSSSPATVTMIYEHQLQLFFHPSAFQTGSSNGSNRTRSNSPISLTYTASQQPSTTLRFFLQLLRASLQALPQSSTPISSLLTLVSNGWDTALSLQESERRLAIEALTQSRIVSDERLALVSTILLPKVQSKVRVTFDVAAAVGEMELSTTFQPRVEVVYGEPYNEGKMTEFLVREVAGGVETWSDAVLALKERLLARGVKGGKRV